MTADTEKLIALGKSAVSMAFEVDRANAALGRRILRVIADMSEALHDADAAEVRALLATLDEVLVTFVSVYQSVEDDGDDPDEIIARAEASGWYSREDGEA